MTTDYERVAQALATGADPDMLCTTCPWDRLCVRPPEMTRADVERQLREARLEDERIDVAARAKGEASSPFPLTSLFTMVHLSGRDTQSQVCPVFALRLRTEDGRALAETIRSHMRGGGRCAGSPGRRAA